MTVIRAYYKVVLVVSMADFSIKCNLRCIFDSINNHTKTVEKSRGFHPFYYIKNEFETIHSCFEVHYDKIII